MPTFIVLVDIKESKNGEHGSSSVSEGYLPKITRGGSDIREDA